MDNKIIKKAIRGDDESFGALIEKRQNKIYKIAYSYVKNEQDALDIVQEAVYKSFVSIHKLKNPEYFDTWLVRIVINCAIDSINKSKRNLKLKESHENTKESIGNLDESIDLHSALEKLDPKHKTIVILRYFEDLKFADIADILECPVGTVKTYLYRALKYLKISIEEGDLSE